MGADPIGRRLWVDRRAGRPEQKIEIIGVTRDTKYRNIREELRAAGPRSDRTGRRFRSAGAVRRESARATSPD